MVVTCEDKQPSPEIKKLIEKITPLQKTSTAQEKYKAILERKCYDHHCFLECVQLRLDTHRGTQNVSTVQQYADDAFIHMLEHSQ